MPFLTAPHAPAATTRPAHVSSAVKTGHPPHPPSGGRLALYVLLVAAVAVAVRAVGIDTWSLWEDEEGSLTRSQEYLFRGFQKYFPLFFFVLKQYADWVGMSVGALRVLPAAAGVLGIVFVMTGFRRRITPGTAAVAGLLLAVNIGHLFFSQSIRYYTTVLAFEVLALAWFFDGFESGKVRKLALSLAAYVLALITHFSALLLGPVFVGYLILTALRGERGGGYKLRWYLVYGVVLAAVGAVFSWRMLLLQAEFDGGLGGPIPSQRDPAHVGTTIAAYFGLPLLGLGLLAPWLARELPRRTLLLFLVAGFVPVLELLTLTAMNFVNVTWYYGFVGMVGLAVLSAASLTSLWNRGYRRAAAGLAVATFGYYGCFLGMYYTVAHGDRPRWADAARFVRDEYGIRPDAGPGVPKVYANVPGPVAFHLGTHPSTHEPARIIRGLPADPADIPTGAVFVVEPRSLSPEYRAWFAGRCELKARFEAQTGPADRSVCVYQYRTPPPTPPAGPSTR